MDRRANVARAPQAKDDRVTVSLYAALSAKDGAGDELTRLRAAIEETFGWALPVSEGKEDEELVISRGMGARKDAVEEEEREAGRRKDRATEDPRDRKRTTVPVALPE